MRRCSQHKHRPMNEHQEDEVLFFPVNQGHRIGAWSSMLSIKPTLHNYLNERCERLNRITRRSKSIAERFFHAHSQLLVHPHVQFV
jgi:hypothetical protein